MQPVNLFTLATRQATWLSARQAAVAGNIANVNTTGYRAMDIAPFDKVLEKSGVTLAATQSGHFGLRAGEMATPAVEDDATTAAMPSQNSVVLEHELMKAGEIGRSFEMNTAIVKAFHRMFILSVKS